MNESTDIKIYKVISVPDMFQHYPSIRQLLFGMNKDRMGDFSCTINEFGTITFLNKAKLFAKSYTADKLKEVEVNSLALEIIDKFNKKVNESPYFQKNRFPDFIQKQYLKPSVITKAVNPFTNKFDHYVITHSFIARPLSQHDNIPIFDAIVELRIDGGKNLLGFYYKWRPILSFFTAKRYKIFIKENKANSDFDLPLEEPQLGYKFEDDKDLLLPYYLGLSQSQSFFIPASEYSDKSSPLKNPSPLSISSDQWIKSDFNQILKKEKLYELAIATNNFDPNKVEGWNDFKKEGQYYNPFKWYNYKSNEQPERTNVIANSQGQSETLSEISGYIFYNTETGQKLWNLLFYFQQFNTKYNPPEYLIRQMLTEAKKALYVPNTELGKLIVGNFDFTYDGYKCCILVRFKFKIDEDVEKSIEPQMREQLFKAIAKYWTNSGYGLVRDNGIKNDFLPIFIYLQEVADEKSVHKIAHIQNTIPIIGDRAIVLDEINILPSADQRTLAHEFGHVLGNNDEYEPPTAFEKYIGTIIWIDDQYKDDISALMNSGDGLRDRYFEHYLTAVQAFDSSNNYSLSRLQNK